MIGSPAYLRVGVVHPVEHVGDRPGAGVGAREGPGRGDLVASIEQFLLRGRGDRDRDDAEAGKRKQLARFGDAVLVEIAPDLQRSNRVVGIDRAVAVEIGEAVVVGIDLAVLVAVELGELGEARGRRRTSR